MVKNLNREIADMGRHPSSSVTFSCSKKPENGPDKNGHLSRTKNLSGGAGAAWLVGRDGSARALAGKLLGIDVQNPVALGARARYRHLYAKPDREVIA